MTADEMTPTLQEFVHSFVPTKWPVHTPEDLFYWNLKGSIALSAFTVRVAFLMRAGMTFSRAGYVATDTYAWSRIVSKGTRLIQAGKFVGRTVTHPVVLVPAVSVAGAHAVTSAYDRHVVQQAPEHQRSGFWDFFAAMLTGTGPSASYTDI